MPRRRDGGASRPAPATGLPERMNSSTARVRSQSLCRVLRWEVRDLQNPGNDSSIAGGGGCMSLIRLVDVHKSFGTVVA